MCYNVKAVTPLGELVKQFKAVQAPAVEFTPYEKGSGFAHPILPVISVGKPNQIQLFKWGLIPAWAGGFVGFKH
ncbi:hypothetical protein [Larkinella terrae]|uniref:SOS response-associated peptidase n=1 Tax=Larkinella terrae TaxID=2025311 RepID=A0A7K0EIU3_9BACT|nr:hypothetical protein [Larkinella terrae]MRS61652.1 hypothetical protein [Larkinella terrae]